MAIGKYRPYCGFLNCQPLKTKKGTFKKFPFLRGFQREKGHAKEISCLKEFFIFLCIWNFLLL